MCGLKFLCKKTISIIFAILLIAIAIILGVFCTPNKNVVNVNNIDEFEYTEEYLNYLKIKDNANYKNYGIIPRKYKVNAPSNEFSKSLVQNSINVSTGKSSYCLANNFNSNYSVLNNNCANINMRIENQGYYGVCFAVASMTALETNVAVKTGEYYDFSTLHEVYLYDLDEHEGTAEDNIVNSTVNGGNFTMIYESIQKYGAVLEEEMPFPSTNPASIGATYYGTLTTPTYGQAGFPTFSIDANTETNIRNLKGFKYTSGAVDFESVVGNSISEKTNYYQTQYGYNGYSDFQKRVKDHIITNGGLYCGYYTTDPYGQVNSLYNKDTNDYYNYYNDGTLAGSTISNHGITIIGWDDNYSKNNFANTPADDGAYIALNSWGNSSNFFYISYCDYLVENSLSGYTESKDVEDYRTYEYWSNSDYSDDIFDDSFSVHRSTLSSSTTSKYVANIYTKSVSDNEYIKKIYVPVINGASAEVFINPINDSLSESSNYVSKIDYPELDTVINSGDINSSYGIITLNKPLQVHNNFVIKLKYTNLNLSKAFLYKSKEDGCAKNTLISNSEFSGYSNFNSLGVIPIVVQTIVGNKNAIYTNALNDRITRNVFNNTLNNSLYIPFGVSNINTFNNEVSVTIEKLGNFLNTNVTSDFTIVKNTITNTNVVTNTDYKPSNIYINIPQYIDIGVYKISLNYGNVQIYKAFTVKNFTINDVALPTRYTVSYNIEPSETINNQLYYYYNWKNFELPIINNGGTFDGWYENSSYTGDKSSIYLSMPNSNLNLYARVISLDVKINIQGETVGVTEVQFDGNSVQLNAGVEIQAGYNYTYSWIKVGSETVLSSTSELVLNGNVSDSGEFRCNVQKNNGVETILGYGVINLQIEPKSIVITKIGENSYTKTYDGNVNYNGTISVNTDYTVSGILLEDEENVSIQVNSKVFNSKNVNSANSLTVGFALNDSTGNYELQNNSITFNTNVSITQKQLSVINLVAGNNGNKEYDGTTNVSISGGELVGKIEEDDVIADFPITGTIDSPNINNNVEVLYNNITLSGEQASNYSVIQPEIYVNVVPHSTNINWVVGTQSNNTPYDVNSSFVYNGQNQSANLLAYFEKTDNTIQWLEVDFDGASFINAQNYNVSAVTDGIVGYNFTNSTTVIIINKSTLVLKTLPNVSTIQINEQISNSVISGGEVVVLHDQSITIDGEFSWNSGSTSFGLIGTYDALAKFIPDNNNYETLASITLRVSVGTILATIQTLPTISAIFYGSTIETSVISGGVVVDESNNPIAGSWLWVDNSIVAESLNAINTQARFIPNNSDYAEIGQIFTIVVNKAIISITPKTTSIFYGDTPSNSGVNYSGFKLGDTISEISGEIIYSYSYNQFDEIGEYIISINVDNLAADNYIFSGNNGVLNVSERVVQIEWEDLANNEIHYEYNNEPQIPRANVNNLVNNDECELTISLNVTSAKTVGLYYATVVTVSNSNYTLPANCTVVFKIIPKIIDLNWISTDLTYNKKSQIPNYTIAEGSIYDSDTCELSAWEFSGGNGISAGSHIVKAKQLSNTNYALSESSVAEYSYNIMQKTVNVSWGISSFIYNGRFQSPSAIISNIYLHDVVELTISGEQKNVGNYKATISSITGDSSANYTINGINENLLEHNFSISPKTVTITWGVTTLKYNGKNQTPTADVTSGLVSGDVCGVIYSGAKKNVGENYLAVARAGNMNYQILENNTITYSIEKANIKIKAKNLESYENTTIKNYIFEVVDGELFDGDELLVLFKSDVNRDSEVGEYDIYILSADNPNYDIEVEPGVYVIKEFNVKLVALISAISVVVLFIVEIVFAVIDTKKKKALFVKKKSEERKLFDKISQEINKNKD